MKRKPSDPKSPGRRSGSARKKAAAEAKVLEEAKLRARNMEILMGVEEGDLPFWPGSSVQLRIGAIRPMRTTDSVVGKPGLQGDLIASASSYVFDIPNYADVTLSLDPRAHVEFVVGSSSRVLGVRREPSGPWTFTVTLTGADMVRLRSFATAVDPGAAAWSAPEATVTIRCEKLTPLRIEGHETPNFVGLVSSLQLGSASDGAS